MSDLDEAGEIPPKNRSGRRDVPIVGPFRALPLEHRMRTGRREGFVEERDRTLRARLG
jgi:hypothetical protein